MTDLPYPPPYQDIATLALHLGISEDEVERYLKLGKLPEPKKIGGLRRWSWKDVNKVWKWRPGKLRKGSTSRIYVVGFNEYVKIGYTENLKQRLTNLQTGLPELLVLYGSIENIDKSDEAHLHARFAVYRLQGEWFRKEGDLAAWIEAGCKL